MTFESKITPVIRDEEPISLNKRQAVNNVAEWGVGYFGRKVTIVGAVIEDIFGERYIECEPMVVSVDNGLKLTHHRKFWKNGIEVDWEELNYDQQLQLLRKMTTE